MKRIKLSLLLLCLAVFGFSQGGIGICDWEEQAGRWSNNPLVWDCPIVTYWVAMNCLPESMVDGSTEAEALAAVHAGVQTWNGIAGIELKPAVSKVTADINIKCGDLIPYYAGSIQYFPEVRINSDLSEWGFSTSLPCMDGTAPPPDRTLDLQLLIAHEVGHAIGFNHEDCCMGVMRSGSAHGAPHEGLPTCPDDRELSADDIEGLEVTYPDVGITQLFDITCEGYGGFELSDKFDNCVQHELNYLWTVNYPYYVKTGQLTRSITVGSLENCYEETIKVTATITSPSFTGNCFFEEKFEMTKPDDCCQITIGGGGTLSTCCGKLTKMGINTDFLKEMGCDPKSLNYYWFLPDGFYVPLPYHPNRPWIAVTQNEELCGNCMPTSLITLKIFGECLEEPICITQEVDACCKPYTPKYLNSKLVKNEEGCYEIKMDFGPDNCDVDVIWNVWFDGEFQGSVGNLENNIWDLDCITCQTKNIKVAFSLTNACGGQSYLHYLSFPKGDCIKEGDDAPIELRMAQDEDPPRPTIYPNPASNSVTLSNPMTKHGTAVAQIFDIYGKLIVRMDLEGEQNFDISKFASGVYLVTFDYPGSDIHVVEKLVVQ